MRKFAGMRAYHPPTGGEIHQYGTREITGYGILQQRTMKSDHHAPAYNYPVKTWDNPTKPDTELTFYNEIVELKQMNNALREYPNWYINEYMEIFMKNQRKEYFLDYVRPPLAPTFLFYILDLHMPNWGKPSPRSDSRIGWCEDYAGHCMYFEKETDGAIRPRMYNNMNPENYDNPEAVYAMKNLFGIEDSMFVLIYLVQIATKEIIPEWAYAKQSQWPENFMFWFIQIGIVTKTQLKLLIGLNKQQSTIPYKSIRKIQFVKTQEEAEHKFQYGEDRMNTWYCYTGDYSKGWGLLMAKHGFYEKILAEHKVKWHSTHRGHITGYKVLNDWGAAKMLKEYWRKNPAAQLIFPREKAMNALVVLCYCACHFGAPNTFRVNATTSQMLNEAGERNDQMDLHYEDQFRQDTQNIMLTYEKKENVNDYGGMVYVFLDPVIKLVTMNWCFVDMLKRNAGCVDNALNDMQNNNMDIYHYVKPIVDELKDCKEQVRQLYEVNNETWQFTPDIVRMFCAVHKVRRILGGFVTKLELARLFAGGYVHIDSKKGDNLGDVKHMINHFGTYYEDHVNIQRHVIAQVGDFRNDYSMRQAIHWLNAPRMFLDGEQEYQDEVVDPFHNVQPHIQEHIALLAYNHKLNIRDVFNNGKFCYDYLAKLEDSEYDSEKTRRGQKYWERSMTQQIVKKTGDFEFKVEELDAVQRVTRFNGCDPNAAIDGLEIWFLLMGRTLSVRERAYLSRFWKAMYPELKDNTLSVFQLFVKNNIQKTPEEWQDNFDINWVKAKGLEWNNMVNNANDRRAQKPRLMLEFIYGKNLGMRMTMTMIRVATEERMRRYFELSRNGKWQLLQGQILRLLIVAHALDSRKYLYNQKSLYFARPDPSALTLLPAVIDFKVIYPMTLWRETAMKQLDADIKKIKKSKKIRLEMSEITNGLLHQSDEEILKCMHDVNFLESRIACVLALSNRHSESVDFSGQMDYYLRYPSEMPVCPHKNRVELTAFVKQMNTERVLKACQVPDGRDSRIKTFVTVPELHPPSIFGKLLLFNFDSIFAGAVIRGKMKWIWSRSAGLQSNKWIGAYVNDPEPFNAGETEHLDIPDDDTYEPSEEHWNLRNNIDIMNAQYGTRIYNTHLFGFMQLGRPISCKQMQEYQTPGFGSMLEDPQNRYCYPIKRFWKLNDPIQVYPQSMNIEVPNRGSWTIDLSVYESQKFTKTLQDALKNNQVTFIPGCHQNWMTTPVTLKPHSAMAEKQTLNDLSDWNCEDVIRAILEEPNLLKDPPFLGGSFAAALKGKVTWPGYQKESIMSGCCGVAHLREFLEVKNNGPLLRNPKLELKEEMLQEDIKVMIRRERRFYKKFDKDVVFTRLQMNIYDCNIRHMCLYGAPGNRNMAVGHFRFKTRAKNFTANVFIARGKVDIGDWSGDDWCRCGASGTEGVVMVQCSTYRETEKEHTNQVIIGPAMNPDTRLTGVIGTSGQPFWRNKQSQRIQSHSCTILYDRATDMLVLYNNQAKTATFVRGMSTVLGWTCDNLELVVTTEDDIEECKFARPDELLPEIHNELIRITSKWTSTTAMLNSIGIDLVRAFVRQDRNDLHGHWSAKPDNFWWTRKSKNLTQWHCYYPAMWITLVRKHIASKQ